MNNIRILIGGLVALASQAAMAEGDTNQSIQLRAQSFGGVESTYRSYTYRSSNEDGSSFHLKAVQSDRRTTAGLPALNVGGNDLEFGVTANIPGVAGTYSLGFAFPTTFADSSTSFVYGVTRSVSDSLDISLKGYSGFTAANALFLTKTFKIGEGTTFSAEIGGMITGYSTVDETTGAAKRNALVNARLTHQFSSMLEGFVGVTNTLGDTTRFSLNSSVGNKYAFTFGIGGKF